MQMYVVNRSSALLASNDSMRSDLSGKPLSALAPSSSNLSDIATMKVKATEVQQIKEYVEVQPDSIKVKEVTEVTEKLTIKVDDHHDHHEQCPPKIECLPACSPKPSCEVKPACPPKPACDPCNTNYATYNGYSTWGWGWLASIILWTIIFTVLFWLIFYSLKPPFVLQTDSNQVDTAKVLLAAVISALILVAVIVLIKFAINRSRYY